MQDDQGFMGLKLLESHSSCAQSKFPSENFGLSSTPLLLLLLILEGVASGDVPEDLISIIMQPPISCLTISSVSGFTFCPVVSFT